MIQAFSALIVAFSALVANPQFLTNTSVQSQAFAMIPAIESLGEQIQDITPTSTDQTATSTDNGSSTDILATSTTSSTDNMLGSNTDNSTTTQNTAPTQIPWDANPPTRLVDQMVVVPGSSSVQFYMNCHAKVCDSATIQIDGQTLDFVTSTQGVISTDLNLTVALSTGSYPYTIQVNSGDFYSVYSDSVSVGE